VLCQEVRAQVSRPVYIRQVSPDDLEPVRRFIAGLSTTTAYLRFFSGIGRMPTALLRRLVEVDHAQTEAYVAWSGDEVIGHASYARVPEDVTGVEIAVVVTDAWQRNGLGSRLMREALAAANRQGYGALHIRVLAQNQPVDRWVRRIWPEVRPTLIDGEYEYLVPLAA
jgi:predicted N-acetyltransferase YhbS